MKSLRDIEDDLEYQDQQKPQDNFEFFAMLAIAFFCGTLLGIALLQIIR